jgi:cardiolipin synthase
MELSFFHEVGPNRVRLLRDAAGLVAMLEAIVEAKEEILLEMYWFHLDRTGLEFRDALVERARAGVSVRVSYDAIGSLGAPSSMWTPLIEAGGEVFEFAPVSPFRRRFNVSRVTFRDHRKILVVDRKRGFTGGVNIGDPWRAAERGGAGWRDDSIEVVGPVAQDLRALFFETWRRSGRKESPHVRRLPRKTEGDVVVLANQLTHGRRRGIRHAYLSGLRQAQKRIDIANAYFLPGPTFLLAMRKARRRGVEIRILIPGTSDVWLVSLAVAWLVATLVKSDIRVFAFRGRVLHSKTALFDERTVTIGSSNLDMRSMRYNLECNVAVHDANFARTVRASFELDLESSVELSVDGWRQRPLWIRVLAWFAYLFRQFL